MSAEHNKESFWNLKPCLASSKKFLNHCYVVDELFYVWIRWNADGKPGSGITENKCWGKVGEGGGLLFLSPADCFNPTGSYPYTFNNPAGQS